MSSSKNIQDLRSHARTRLAPSKKKGLSRKERLDLYKRFLKTEEHRIYLLHRSGASGLRVAGRRSDLIDLVVRNLHEDALHETNGDGTPSSLAIIAAGGYGRGRLNPHSDIDIHFISPTGARKLSKNDQKLVESILYMLYDCGFKVGHAVRSIRETIQQANEDNKTKSSIIEARLVSGNAELFEKLMEEFHKKCITRHEKAYLRTRLDDLHTRHAKWSDTVYLQEPNVKEGCGSLRDYQNLIWVTYVKLGTTRLADLRDQKLMSVSAYRELRKGYDFLMRVRNDLHYEQKRSGDILTLRLQGVVARNFNYPQRGILRKTEAFMRDYYEHTRNILQRTSEVLDAFFLEQDGGKGTSPLAALLPGASKKEDTSIKGFIIKQDRLYAAPELRFTDDPNQILMVFRHSQLRKLRLAPELVQKLQRHYKHINRSFRYSNSNRETFEAIMARKGEVAPTLRQMHRAGVLGRYMPEFGALTNLVQHEFFHRYTADEHTLRCIEELDKLATDECPKAELFRNLFLALEDPFVLYLALLLHDTGRASNTDAHDQASAVLANQVCRRFNVNSRRRRLILFLVDHHLTFWRTATTKNLEDPQTISEFAGIMRDRERLDYLLLLTYADSNGTNEEAWTDWKASLIRQLYLTTVEYFEDHETFLKKHESDKAILRDQVEIELHSEFAGDIVRHFDNSNERYFRTQGPIRISNHIRLIAEHEKADPEIPTFKWEAFPEKGWSHLSVVLKNRGGFLSIVAGALSAERINILGADLFVRSDDVVLDIFRVCTTDFSPVTSEKTIAKVEKHIHEALSGSPPDFEALIAKAPRRSGEEEPDFHIPQRVYIDQHAAGDETIVELQVRDRLGLLYDIFHAITRLGLEVTNARISTTCGAAIDTIHVIDENGEKLSSDDRLRDLQSAVESAVGVDR